MPRMRHPDTGAVIDAADSAVPVLARSGWVVLSDTERDQLDQAAAEDARARDAAMAPHPTQPTPAEPAPAPPADAVAPRRQAPAIKEESA